MFSNRPTAIIFDFVSNHSTGSSSAQLRILHTSNSTDRRSGRWNPQRYRRKHRNGVNSVTDRNTSRSSRRSLPLRISRKSKLLHSINLGGTHRSPINCHRNLCLRTHSCNPTSILSTHGRNSTRFHDDPYRGDFNP